MPKTAPKKTDVRTDMRICLHVTREEADLIKRLAYASGVIRPTFYAAAMMHFASLSTAERKRIVRERFQGEEQED